MKKIPTLFERVFRRNKIADIKPNITEGCENAFLHGAATIKLDGSCCAIIDGELYRRYDAKNGKPVPDGAIKCQESADPVTGHLPCWVKCDRNNSSDKWFWKAYDESTAIAGKLPDATYEAIGKHFQGNPYGLEKDYLERHGIREVAVESTFEAVREYLRGHYIEGLVFWYAGKPVCKIKRTDFGFSWNQTPERK